MAVMPVVFVLLAGLADLRLTTELVGLRVRAALHNDGAAPVTVTVGDKCAGPTPFQLRVDGRPRPFVAEARPCAEPRPVQRTLPAGGEYAILSDSLDGRRHRIEASFGDVIAPLLQVDTVVRVDLKVAASARVAAGRPVSVEIVHVNRSAEEVPLPVCGEDRLLIDGHEQPMAPPAGQVCDRAPRTLRVRGAFVTRGEVTLAPGEHKLRARWREVQSNDVEVHVEP